MKPNEIITALRECSANTAACRKCPVYNQSAGCLDLLHQEAAELIEGLLAERRWIPVTERLPETNGQYFCYVRSCAFRGSHYCSILNYDKNGFRSGHIYTDDVTHWMPLPEPPEKLQLGNGGNT